MFRNYKSSPPTTSKIAFKRTVKNLFLANEDHYSDPISLDFLSDLDLKTEYCQDYSEYSKVPHPPYSEGIFGYPYMRPPPKCRTFKSSALETLISDLKIKIKDQDLARLVENTLPNTLDTTILWHTEMGEAETFVVTGDIHAEWLRDSARQLSVYMPLVKHDSLLKQLMRGAINTQARFINIAPYCNAFHPPPESHVKKGNSAKDSVFPVPDWTKVFECKYEIDSLASFLTLTNDYLEHSDYDMTVINLRWIAAFENILVVLRRESEPLFNAQTGYANSAFYTFQRYTNIGSETLPLSGEGNPVNYGTGLIRSAFRPSDDATILQFFVPGNAQMLGELRRLKKNVFEKINVNLYHNEILMQNLEQIITAIDSGLKKFGINNHPRWGRVFAYEVDGYGGATFMDDANIPSLLSLPELGVVDVGDEIYQNTRKMILSKDGNPYYLKGPYLEGIGGPHVGVHHAWPMSLCVRIRTTDDETEIMENLELLMKTTAGLGLMHEGVNVSHSKGMDYTRSWFSWCNSEFAKTILHLAKHKPHLIFKEEHANQPYNLDTLFNEDEKIG